MRENAGDFSEEALGVVLVEATAGLAAVMAGATMRFSNGGGAYSGRLNSS